MVTPVTTPRRTLNRALTASALFAAFGLSYLPGLHDTFALFDRGAGIGALFTAPGLTAVPPSWVFRHALLLAGVFFLAPALAPLGRILLNWVGRAREGLGDWMVVGILGAATALAAAGLAYASLGAEGHVWDEREFDFQARILASGRLTATAPATDERVTLEGGGKNNFLVGTNEGVRDRKWFTIYMPVWPAALAIGEALGRPWLVNPVIGFITAFILFGYARRLVGADGALLAVLLYTLSPFILFNNASFFSEPVFLLLFLLFLWAYDAAKGGKKGAALAAGALLSLSFGAREYAAFAAALPVVALWVYGVIRRREPARGLAWFVPGIILGAAPLLAYNAVTGGNPFRFPRFYALKTHFGLSLPFLSGDMALFTTRRLWVFATDLLGWPLASALPALVPLFLKKIPPRLKPLYLAAAATMLLFVLPHHKGINYGARYYYGLLPAALVGGGWGLTLLPEWLTRRWRAAAGTAAVAALLAFAALTVPYLAAVEPIYRDYWGFPEGKKPWVTPQLEQALSEYGVWQAVIFVAPPARCDGPAPNDVALKNDIIFARDRGPLNANFAATLPPRPCLLCDYREFEETGTLRVIDAAPPPKTGVKK